MKFRRERKACKELRGGNEQFFSARPFMSTGNQQHLEVFRRRCGDTGQATTVHEVQSGRKAFPHDPLVSPASPAPRRTRSTRHPRHLGGRPTATHLRCRLPRPPAITNNRIVQRFLTGRQLLRSGAKKGKRARSEVRRAATLAWIRRDDCSSPNPLEQPHPGPFDQDGKFSARSGSSFGVRAPAQSTRTISSMWPHSPMRPIRPNRSGVRHRQREGTGSDGVHP